MLRQSGSTELFIPIASALSKPDICKSPLADIRPNADAIAAAK